MSGPCCDNCVYCVCDLEHLRRQVWMGESLWPQCANHPLWPGQLHDVSGVPCRNYRRKPKLPSGDAVRMIPLGDGFYAYVDAADYEWLTRWNWRLHCGYAVRQEKGKRVFMHRQIMQPPKGMIVDHCDANRANNCRFNLRVCTPTENQRNKRKRHGAHSKFIGICYDKRQRKWSAKCRFAGKRHWLGYFDDEVDAARVYDRAAVESFGEFAHLNFPDEWPPERRAEVYAQRDAAKEKGKRKKVKGRRQAKGKTPGAKSRATRAERRATDLRTEDRRRRTAGTKEGKTKKAKGKMHAAKRRTKSERVTGHRSRTTAPKRRQP